MRSRKGLDVKAEVAGKQASEYQTSDLECDARGETKDGFGKQAFNIASGILKLMKDAFNAFGQGIERGIKFRRVSDSLVGVPGEITPLTVSCVMSACSLRLKAFVSQNVAFVDGMQHNFSGQSLVRVSWHEIIGQR